MGIGRLALLTIGIAVGSGAACKDQGPDPNACQQTYGFGNYGCADVTGAVLSSSDLPVINAAVTAGGPTDPYDPIYVTTDSTGHFRARLLRRWIRPDTDMDTVSTWIHASATAPTTAKDSTFTQVRFYDFGEVPAATSIVFHVNVP